MPVPLLRGTAAQMRILMERADALDLLGREFREILTGNDGVSNATVRNREC